MIIDTNISTGYRINFSKDDGAGQAISNTTQAKLSSFTQAVENT